jgi:hypothetical protein
MRAKSDPWFAEYLLRIGGGSEEANCDDEIHLPDDICIPQTGKDNDLDTLIDYIFPALNATMSNKSYITSRAILSPWNDYLDMIYMKMISHFQEDEMVYHNFDSAVDDPQNY